MAKETVASISKYLPKGLRSKVIASPDNFNKVFRRGLLMRRLDALNSEVTQLPFRIKTLRLDITNLEEEYRALADRLKKLEEDNKWLEFRTDLLFKINEEIIANLRKNTGVASDV